MDYSSFKSQSRSTAERFRTPISKITLIDNDIQMEKEYLEKLKVQRNKTEKLYSEYIDLTKQREKMRQEIEDLHRQLQQWKSKYTHAVEDSKVEVRRLQTENQSYQTQIRKLTAEKLKQSQYASGQYTNKIKDLEDQVSYFRDLQSDKKMRVGELEEKVSKAKRLTLKLTTENDALKLKIKNIENRFEESVKKFQSQRQAFERAKLSFEQERRQLQLAVNDKNEQLETLKSHYESNRSKEKNYIQIYNEFQQSKNYWNYRMEEKSTEIAELQRQVEDFRQKVQTLEDKLQRLERQVKATEEGQRKARKEYDQLQLKCKGQEEELAWVHQRCCQLNEEINGNDLVVQKLKERIADLKEENNVYIKLFEQKREIESERREIFQNQLQQVDKFERLLQNII